MSVNDPNKVTMTTPNSTPSVPAAPAETVADDPFKGFVTKSFNEGKEDVAAPGENEVDDADTDEGDEEHEEGDEEHEAEASAEAPEASEELKPAPKAKKTASDRIAQLVKARNAERTRAEAAEARAAAAEARANGEHPQKKDLTPAPKDGKGKDSRPSPDSYDFGELDQKFIADLARFEAKKALADERSAEQADRQKVEEAETAERLEGEAMSLMETGLEKFGDEFDELVIQGAANKAWALSDTLGQLIGASTVGADIAMHLARDPKEALRIYRLPPMEQAAYFGRMEARFSSPGDVKPKKQVQAPKAPPPPSTKVRGAGGKFSVPSDTNDFSAFEKMANKLN